MCIKQLFSINRDILCSMPDIIIGLAALQHGRRELCTSVVILSVCHHGIHFEVLKLEHCVLCSH